MNKRDQKILRALLEALDEMDGLAVETIVHAEVNLRVKPNALLMEFERALNFAQGRRWVLGVRPEVGDAKWKITDEGRAALAEMQS